MLARSESPHSRLSNGANDLILILHFDAKNGGAFNSHIIEGRTQYSFTQ